VADLAVSIQLAATNAASGPIDEARKSLEGLTGSGDKAQSVFDRLKDGFLEGLGIGTGVEAFNTLKGAIDGVIEGATHFQTMMTEVRNNTGLSAAATQAMSEQVLNLSKTYGESTDSIAEGYKHIINITGDATNATGIMTIALQSAVSTGANTAQVANLLANAMHEYGTDVSTAATAQQRMTDVQDAAARTMGIMHIAAQEANMDLSQFAEESGRAVGIGASMHIPLEQISAAFADLTKHGFDAAGAGVQVTDMMTHMIKVTPAAEKELVRLSKATGIDLVSDFSSAGLATKGLVGVLDDLHAAYIKSGMKESDFAEETFKLVAALRGGLGVNALLTTGYGDLHKILGDVSDRTREVTVTTDGWNATAATTERQWKILTTSVQDFSIELGQHALPLLTPLLTWFNEQLPRAVSGATVAFNDFIEPLGGPFTAVVAGLGAGLQAAIGVAHQFADTFGAQKALLDGLAGSVGSYFSALGSAAQKALGGDLVGAFTAATGTLFGFNKTLAQFGADWSKALLDWVQASVPPLMARLGDWLGVVGEWISGTAIPYLGTLLPQLAHEFVNWVAAVGPPLLAQLGTILASLGGWIGTTATWLAGRFGDWATALWNWIPGATAPMLEGLGTLLGSIGSWMQGTALPFLADHVQVWAAALSGWVGQVASPILSVLGDLLATVGNWLTGTALPFFTDHVGEWAGAFWGWVSDVAPPLLAQLGDLLGMVDDWLTATALPYLKDQLGAWAGAFVDWAASIAPDVLSALGDFLGAVGDWMQTTALPFLGSHAGAWGGVLVNWVVGIGPTVLGALGGLLDAVGSWMNGTALPFLAAHVQQWTAPLVGWAAAATPPFIGSLASLLGSFAAWFVSTLPTIAARLADWTAALAGWAVAAAPAFIASLSDLASRLADWFTGTALPSIVQHLAEWAAAFVGWITPLIPGILAALGQVKDRLIDWVVDTALPTLGVALSFWGGKFVAWVVDVWPNLQAEMGRLKDQLIDWIQNRAAPEIGHAVDSWSTAFTDAVPAMKPLVDFLGQTLPPLLTWLTQTGWPMLTQAASDFWDKLKTLPDFLDQLGKALDQKGVANDLKDAWGNLKDAAVLLWQDIEKVWKPADDARDIITKTKTPAEELASAIKGASSALKTATQDFKDVAAALEPAGKQADAFNLSIKTTSEGLHKFFTDTGTLLGGFQVTWHKGFMDFGDNVEDLEKKVGLWEKALGDRFSEAGTIVSKFAKDVVQWFADIDKAVNGWLDNLGQALDKAVPLWKPLMDALAKLHQWLDTPIAIKIDTSGVPSWIVDRFGGGGGSTSSAATDTGTAAAAPNDQNGRPGGGSGASTPNSVEAYVRQAATARGINPDTAVGVINSEGGTNPAAWASPGDGGSSFGPGQLHYGGVATGGNAVAGLGDAFTKQTGLDARDPNTWQQQVDYILNQAAAGGWGPWHGAARVGIGNREGIGPNAQQLPISAPGGGFDPSNIPQGDQGTPGGTVTSAAASGHSTGGVPLGWNQDQVIANPGSFSTTRQVAIAICGPTAYAMIEAAAGAPPTLAQAIAANKSWSTEGEGGFSAFLTALASAGNVQTTVQYDPATMRGPATDQQKSDFAANVGGGSMGTISTPGHYFQASGYDASTQKFDVGDTGTVVGGGTQMTLAEMEAKEGKITGLVTELTTLGAASHAVLAGQFPSDIAVSDGAIQVFADRFKVTWPEAAHDLSQIEQGAKVTMGTVIPGQLAVTDQAVEAFAAQWNISWGEARAILTTSSTAIGAGTAAINTAVQLTDAAVQTFGDRWGLSFDKAKAALSSGAAAAKSGMGAVADSFASSDTVVESFATTWNTSWDEARAALALARTDIGDGTKAVTGDLALTDSAVQSFADQWGVSIGDARKMLTAGKIEIGDGMKAVDASLKTSGQSAADFAALHKDKLLPALSGTQAAATSLATAGMGALPGPTDQAASAATQIAAVLLDLDDGLMGKGKHSGTSGLVADIQAFIDKLKAIPTDIAVNISTNVSGGAGGFGSEGGAIAPSGGGGSGGGGGGGSADFSTYAGRQAYRDSHPDAVVDASGAYTPPGHAEGGDVPPGELSVVGEKGPELFMAPTSGGHIFPTGTGPAQTGDTYHVTVNVHGSVTSDRDLADKIYDALLQKRRANGSLGLG